MNRITNKHERTQHEKISTKRGKSQETIKNKHDNGTNDMKMTTHDNDNDNNIKNHSTSNNNNTFNNNNNNN